MIKSSTTSNPALSQLKKTFLYHNKKAITRFGVFTKTLTLFSVMGLSIIWVLYDLLLCENFDRIIFYFISGFIGSFAISILLIFSSYKNLVFILLYSVFEGFLLSSLSLLASCWHGPTLPLQAIGYTIIIFCIMLFLYASKIIRITPSYQNLIRSCLSGILFFHLIRFLLSVTTGIHILGSYSSPLNIGFSIFVLVIASLSLIEDFYNIDRLTKIKISKTYEWYLAFSLILSIVWVYVRVLNLLMRIRGRKR